MQQGGPEIAVEDDVLDVSDADIEAIELDGSDAVELLDDDAPEGT